MDAATRERLLSTIDAILNTGAYTKIERLRLLDLWWRVAICDHGDRAQLGRADSEFLLHVVTRVARRSAIATTALVMSVMAMSHGVLGS
jgi:hypothetical protein